MRRETAEIVIESLASMFERLGMSFDKLIATNQFDRFLPKEFQKYFKYGNDREALIKYLVKHGPEPSPEELGKLPAFAIRFPRMMRAALLDTAQQLPGNAGRRSKIARGEWGKVCKEVQQFMRSNPFPRAIEKVADHYDVHPRTIRRIWKAWKGEQQ